MLYVWGRKDGGVEKAVAAYPIKNLQVRPRRTCSRFQPVILHSVLVVLIKLDGEDQIVQRRRLVIAYVDVDSDSRATRYSDLRLRRN